METVRVLNCDNFSIGTITAVTVAARDHPWLARVSSDIMVHVKQMDQYADRDGTLAFSAVATADDTVVLTWQDGSTTFTFGDGLGGTVDVGASATDSAQNLKAAIEAYALANGIDIVVSGGAATLTFTTNDPYVEVTEGVDDGAVMTVTDIDYSEPATEDDAPFTEFDDLFFLVAENEGLSFIGAEDNGFCSVAEVKMSA